MSLVTRQDHERIERELLAPWAAKAAESKGREYPSAPDPLRTEFQRDRDRIIHCSAFRKLEFKTQVHVITAGDYYRTRLTHTMEVAQIARTLARALNANSDLAEAIALCHDFGHTPFGHAGEESMRECMAKQGGFEHNEQGLRTVEYLEERSPKYPGMNLTFEVREGIIKHDTDYDKPTADERYLPGKKATLESQLCDLADEIAYNNADLDDALKMGLLTEDELLTVEWVGELFHRTRKEMPEAPQKYVTYRVLSAMYDEHVNSVLTHTVEALHASGVKSADDVRNYPSRIADFSPSFKAKVAPLKRYLLDRVYFHPETMKNSLKARRMIRDLFHAYHEHPRLLPWKYQRRIEKEGAERVICDYISGMTDRYFNEQYVSIFYAPSV